MKNHNASERTINVENIFAMDRLELMIVLKPENQLLLSGL